MLLKIRIVWGIEIMKKIFAVAQWEFLEKVKTKTFIISLILTPALIIAFSLLPTLLTEQPDTTTKAIGIVDTSGIYFDSMKNILENYKLENGQPNYILLNLNEKGYSLNEIKDHADSLALKNRIEGYLFINYAGTKNVNVEFRGINVGNFRDIGRFQEAFNDVRITQKLKSARVDSSVAKIVSANVEVKPVKIEKGGKEKKFDFLSVFFTSFILIMLLMMMILYSGGMLIRSLVEEKSNRLIEILISSCTPDELLTGKILGLSALGFAQIIIWVIIGISVVGSSLIPVSAFENILPMLGYFILGFIFYTAVFVGIGSVVSTEQEAQQMTSYISMVLILPVVLAFSAIQNPSSILVKVLSYIPFTIPSIMMLRINISPVPMDEILISLIIMFLSIYITIIIASKIFRIGILSYGKRPSFKEIINWIKEK